MDSASAGHLFSFRTHAHQPEFAGLAQERPSSEVLASIGSRRINHFA
jgi:hypothetical protein